MDAGVELDGHRRMAAVGRRRGVRRGSGWPRGPAGRPSAQNLDSRVVRAARAPAGRPAAARTPCAAPPRPAAMAVVDLHARRRLADARGGQHALALDLDHAGPAVAVGPVAGRGRVAEMRDLDAHAAWRPARWSRPAAAVDLVAVERRSSDRLPLIGHRSSGKVPQHAEQRIGRRLAQAADRGVAHRLRSARSSSGLVPDRLAHQLAPPSRCRSGRACTGRSSRPRRSASGCRAAACMSSWSERTTTAAEPMKQP